MKIKIPIRGEVGSLPGGRLVDRNFSGVLGKGKIRFQKGTQTLNNLYGTDFDQSPLVASALMAFQKHLPLRIEPAQFWVTILQEVAMMVKKNPVKYAHVFSGDPQNKQTVIVLCDELASGDEHWPLAISRFRGKLAEFTGESLVEGFFPRFSTDDADRELVYLVSVMDAASPYFSYEVHTRCGIPMIHLEGTLQDWQSLYVRIGWLEKTFGSNGYFTRLKEIVSSIGNQIYTRTPDHSFWESYFKYNQMSGGDKVTGWITDLFAHVYASHGQMFKDGVHTTHGSNQFPSGLSVVPFIWELYGDRIPMRFFSGLTGIIVKDGAVSPNIGYGVIEGES